MKYTMQHKKDCKHSVVYEVSPSLTHEDRSRLPALSIYVQRSAFPGSMPRELSVEISPALPPSQENKPQ